jgi:hypothetical protein
MPSSRLLCRRSDSVRAQDRLFLQLWNLPMRVLVHDPSHGYENTRDEIAAALPHMVDDFGGRRGQGVIRAVQEWLTAQSVWKVELRHSDAYMLGAHLVRRV